MKSDDERGSTLNDSNLVPLNERTKDEQREIARMGGVASGEARRRRKTIREALIELLAMPCEVEGFEDMTNAEALSVTMLRKGVEKADVRAFEAIADRTDGKPATAIKVEQPIPQSVYDEMERLLMED